MKNVSLFMTKRPTQSALPITEELNWFVFIVSLFHYHVPH